MPETDIGRDTSETMRGGGPIATKTKKEEGTRTEGIRTAYERGKANEIFTKFLDEWASPTGGEFRATPKVASRVGDNWRDLLGKVDELLKDTEYHKEFLAHLKKSIEGSTKETFPSNDTVLSIVQKLGETKTYSNLPAKFRHEDHAEVREAIAKAIKYNLEHPASPQWRSYNIKKALGILDGFGVQSQESVEVQKPIKTGRIFKHTHMEPVREMQELSIEKRLEMFEKGKF